MIQSQIVQLHHKKMSSRKISIKAIFYLSLKSLERSNFKCCNYWTNTAGIDKCQMLVPKSEKGRRSHDCMIVGFTTTYAIST